jgi:hypothetical protein
MNSELATHICIFLLICVLPYAVGSRRGDNE